MRNRKYLAALIALCLLVGLCPAAVTEDLDIDITNEAVELTVPEEEVALEGEPEGNAGYADFIGDVAVEASETIPVDKEHFTYSEYGFDFLGYVRDNIDTNGDGVLSEAERLAVKEICFDSGNALDGLQYFPNLEVLTCEKVYKHLDVTGNPKLRELSVTYSDFESIDLSKNTALEKLSLFENSLKTIDVSKNTKLIELHLNQRGNKPGLSSLDVSANTALKQLGFRYNNVKTIDLSQCPELEYLRCDKNVLTELKLNDSAPLKKLYCSDNQLKRLDVGRYAELEQLECYNNQLTELDLTGCRSLQAIYCGMNQITELDVSATDSLRTLNCISNPLKRLVLTRSIKNLYCYDTTLEELNIYGCPTLIDLYTMTPKSKSYFDAIWNRDYTQYATTSYEMCVGDNVKIVNIEPTPKPTATPAPTATPVPAGGKFKTSTGTYRLDKDGSVTFVKPAKSKKTVAIPDTVKVNGKKAKVTAIGEKAFYKDAKLTTLTLGKYVKTVGKNAFNGCKKLTTVKGGKAVTTLKDGAFKGCAALTAITLNSKVKTIGKNAFYGCKKLKTVTIKTAKLTTKTVGANAFKGVYSTATFKCPAKKLKAYKKLIKSKGAPKKAKYK